jgi:hypothetical protein
MSESWKNDEESEEEELDETVGSHPHCASDVSNVTIGLQVR